MKGLVAVLLAGMAAAQEGARFAVPGARWRTLWQNDSLSKDTDRFFTNAFELSLAIEAEPDTLAWLPLRGDPDAAQHEFAFGQDMFTPEDITTPTPDPQDRPYAGWLHLSYRNAALTLGGADRIDRLDTWELELGIVGPSSLADDAQIQVHEAFGAPRPRGWTNQLKDEPGILLGYERRYRTWYSDDPFGGTFGPVSADLVGLIGARLGNVETSGRLGTTLRVGVNLPRHFGTALRPIGSAPSRVHLEGGVEGRVVLRNIFLDGNTYRRSADVERNVFVSDLHVALVWEPYPWLRFSIRETFRTPEFDSPSTLGDPAQFTSLQLDLIF
ncbi:MAG: lipid A deacylase LpxR family protein [Planctomycetes bacterium]|nr:lipid A deacylase LpxR family protein [Planctomycetota bacterium]